VALLRELGANRIEGFEVSMSMSLPEAVNDFNERRGRGIFQPTVCISDNSSRCTLAMNAAQTSGGPQPKRTLLHRSERH
jgi:hypothetical protein